MKIKLSEEERAKLWSACAMLYDAMDRAAMDRRDDEAAYIDSVVSPIRRLYNESR